MKFVVTLKSDSYKAIYWLTLEWGKFIDIVYVNRKNSIKATVHSCRFQEKYQFYTIANAKNVPLQSGMWIKIT